MNTDVYTKKKYIILNRNVLLFPAAEPRTKMQRSDNTFAKDQAADKDEAVSYINYITLS